MKKPTVILADPDESYLVTLELKFLKELGSRIDLEVITEDSYFEEYFNEPRKADLLVVGEELYSQELQKHTIGSLYVLAEVMERGGTENLSIRKIYKYSSIKEIFNELVSEGLPGIMESDTVKKETQIIAVYSPIGGAGVTTIAAGLGAALAKNHKKVFFLSAEPLQNFRFYLSSQGYLPNEACAVLKNTETHPYAGVKPFLRNEIFDYLPPLYASLSALGLDSEVYYRLIEDVKQSKEYDYIVIDMETGFQEEKAGLLALADRVVVIVMQDAFSVHKTESLMRNLDLKDNEKFVFLCNRFQSEKKNYIVGSKLQSGAGVSEYIGELAIEEADNIIKLEHVGELRQLSYLFM